MCQRVAVFCRTHTWDEFVAKQAERLCDLSRGGHFYVLADETRCHLPVDGFIKFSHTDLDFEPLGLERYFNTNLLWYNGDYPLYKMITALPGYDWYVMVEFDVLTNVNLVGLVNSAVEAGADAVAFNIHPAEREWPWLDTCRGIYENAWRGLIPVLAVSRLAVEHMFTARRRLTRRFRAREIDRMPYCEAFVPTELMQPGRFKVLDLSAVADTSRFEFWPPFLEGSVQLGPKPAFIHPFLDEKRFIPNRLRHEANPGSYFQAGSRLQTEFSGCRLDAVAPHLLAALKQQNDGASEARLRQLLPSLPTA